MNVVGSGLIDLMSVATPFSWTAHVYFNDAVAEAHPDKEAAEWMLRYEEASIV